MKYRLLAIDLDGTLLTDDKRISERNREALAKAQQCGMHVVISTGRAWPGAKAFAAELGLSVPVITSNGAMIVDAVTEEIIYKRDLEPEAAKNVLEAGRKNGVSQIIWSSNRLYGLPVDWRLEDYGRTYGKMTPQPMPPVETLYDAGISKILWYDDPERIASFNEQVHADGGDVMPGGLPKDTAAWMSQPTFLEFFHSDVSKAAALRSVAQILGVSMEETVAVGDAPNDILMLQAAACGVAMGNASESVKAIADFVTEDNMHDGVAVLTERLLRM